MYYPNNLTVQDLSPNPVVIDPVVTDDNENFISKAELEHRLKLATLWQRVTPGAKLLGQSMDSLVETTTPTAVFDSGASATERVSEVPTKNITATVHTQPNPEDPEQAFGNEVNLFLLIVSIVSLVLTLLTLIVALRRSCTTCYNLLEQHSHVSDAINSCLDRRGYSDVEAGSDGAGDTEEESNTEGEEEDLHAAAARALNPRSSSTAQPPTKRRKKTSPSTPPPPPPPSPPATPSPPSREKQFAIFFFLSTYYI